jgi:Mg-chelatase subunit ChlD
LIYARKIIADFKKQTNAQIVNCVVLTDGESNVSKCAGDVHQAFVYHSREKTVARDIQTKQEIVIKKPAADKSVR